jgi:PTS system mannose-specific IIA component
MVGVVVASHGKLAEELIRTAEGVVGPLSSVVGVAVSATEPDSRGRIAEAITKVDQGEGVLLLTDLLGGSPTQLCLSFLADRKVEVITGVNLPMMLKAISLRQNPLPIGEMAAQLAESARKAIGHASLELRKAMR